MPANWDALVTEDIKHRQQNALNQNITEYHQDLITAQIQFSYVQVHTTYRWNKNSDLYLLCLYHQFITSHGETWGVIDE